MKLTTHFTRGTVLACAALLASCASLMPQPAAQKQSFSFDYKLSSTERPGSAGTVLALIKPNYGNDFKYVNSELFTRLRRSMADDVEELILDKGFVLKSDEPFESMDDMVYDDKKTTDMLVKVELFPEFTGANGSWNMKIDFSPQTNYTYSGIVSLIGKITLTGIEPLSGQKIWSKSVTIPEVRNIPIKTERAYPASMHNENVLFNDPGIYNAVGAAFSQQYKSVMDRIAAQLSPEEFAALKPQIKELKARKGY